MKSLVKTTKNISALSLFILSITLSTNIVYADSYANPYFSNKTVGAAWFGQLVGSLYNVLFPILVVYGILQIVIAGYRIMKSEGNPNELADAKDQLTSVLIGLLFAALAIAILRIIIKSFLGIGI